MEWLRNKFATRSLRAWRRGSGEDSCRRSGEKQAAAGDDEGCTCQSAGHPAYREDDIDSLVVRGDTQHSRDQKRYYALGQTDRGRYLFVAFTVRGSLLRVISVRDMNRRERNAYGYHEKKTDA